MITAAPAAQPAGRSLRPLRTGLVAIFLIALPTAATAQVPVGPEFQVNSYSTSYQSFPAAAPDGAGGFVVTWTSDGSVGDDSSEESIQSQRYAANGSPLGSQFQVNQWTTGKQTGSAVAGDSGGGFVVAWSSVGSLGSDADYWSIQARRFANDGSPQGDQFQVNSYTTGSQVGPSVATFEGGFVIVWQSEGSSGSDSSNWSVQARRFTSDGEPLGTDHQVNSFTPSPQYFPAVGGDGAGGFVVTWTSGLSPSEDELFSIWARRYDASGLPAGNEFLVNTYTTSSQYFSEVSRDGDEGFVITWQSQGSNGTDEDDFSIQAQRYLADGSPAGDEFQVNSYTTGKQENASLSPDGDAGFVITWQSDGSSGTDTIGDSIQAQRYSAKGSPAGGEFQVNTSTPGWQEFPAVAADGADGFVVTWLSWVFRAPSPDAPDDYGIFGQRFGDAQIFSDGFESADTSAWSRTVP